MPIAVNEAAIRLYVKQMRPDISQSQIDGFFEHDGLALIASLCYEAGRAFQHNNPSFPVDLPVLPFDDPNLNYKIRQ